MNLNIYKDQVYEVLDFIKEEEKNIFLEIIKNSTEKDWPSAVKNEFNENDTSISGTVLSLDEKEKELRWNIYKRLENLFESPGRINQIAAIQRYKTNTGMGLHTDNELDSSVLFGVVIYLNEDYKGGEINYPNLDLKIKPKERSIIIHPAGIEHEVLNVEGDKTRYIISSFVRGDNNTRFKYGK